MIDSDEIMSAFIERKDSLATSHAVMAEVAEIYAGRKSLVTTELWGPNEKPAVPNLTLVGIDQSAMRVASTLPMPQFFPVRNTKSADDAARTKRTVVLGWWDANHYSRKLRRRARHLIGYASSPVLLRPDPVRRIPMWQVHSPRNTFPAPMLDPDEMCPSSCIFTMERSIAWLKRHYPDHAAVIYKGENYRPDTKLELLEWWDDTECVLVLVGARRPDYETGSTEWGHSRAEALERTPNRAEVCPVVIPGRIALEEAGGVFDQNIGLHERQARMMAYEELAIQRGIISETWLEGADQAEPKVITVANAREGIVGVVKNGRLRELRPEASMAALQAVDRGERAQRIQAGVPAEFGGESPTNVRTGRRGDSVLSAVVDHPTQEHQELLAESAAHELRIAMAIDKAYFNTVKPLVVTWGDAKGTRTYLPRRLFDTDDVAVRYSHPGADINGLVIGGGQRVGLGTLSKRGFMELDPLIDDPEMESDRITVEAIDAAGLAAIQQQASQGAIPLPDLARIKELIRTDRMDWDEAVALVQREAQERQSTTVQPVDPGAPEAQPGLSTPGMGAEAGAVTTPEGVSGLTGLLGALRLGQRSSPQEAAFNSSSGAA